jgi:hypothetical protein
MMNVGKEKKVRQKRGEIFPPEILRAPNLDFCCNAIAGRGVWGIPPQRKIEISLLSLSCCV